MRSKEILKEILDYLENFEEMHKNYNKLTTEMFIDFLQEKKLKNNIEKRKIGGTSDPIIEKRGNNIDTEIAVFVTIMSRYAKVYIKKALHNSIIQTSEEFSFLIVLITFDKLTKTELINKNVMEKTSGTEVINRLINNKLIEQHNNPNDKRSRLIAITEKGKQVIYELLPKMSVASNIIAGNLTESEKAVLFNLLKKLDLFHSSIFLNERNNDLYEIQKNRAKGT